MEEVGISLIIGILVTMVFSAFFSGMEIAFVSSNRMLAEMDKEKTDLHNVLFLCFTLILMVLSVPCLWVIILPWLYMVF